MSRVAIITDSNSGITQEMAAEMGVIVVPMPFVIDGKEYFEDISLTQAEFYEKLVDGAEIYTSQPTPHSIQRLWDKTLEEYDEIVHIPMSSGLSSSCQTAKMLSEDYDGRVHVVNNQRISITQLNSVRDAQKLAGEGKSAEEICDILEKEKMNATIYIMLDTLYYLKKGGRITPAAAALGTLLKLKPVLQIQGEKLDAFAKARTISAAKSVMINAAKTDIEGRITEQGKYKVSIGIAHTKNEEAAKIFQQELREVFPDVEDIYISPLSLSVSCHIGPGALAVAASRIV